MQYAATDTRVLFLDDGNGAYQLDVRELLADGGEPYEAIMTCVRQLQAGEKLQLHAIFEPVPLVRKLGRQGYRLAVDHAGTDHWILTIERS